MRSSIVWGIGFLLAVGLWACSDDNAGGSGANVDLCDDEACVAQCEQDGRVVCGGVCIDPQADARFCGASGDCAGDNAGQDCGDDVCNQGQCGLQCDDGQIACAGTCVDPLSDARHCGASGACVGDEAGTACAAGQLCSGGVCVEDCPDGRIDCGGGCIDPLADNLHCGASGNCQGDSAGQECPGASMCTDGACACPDDGLLCGELCVDPLTDPLFCGASGDCQGPQMGQACSEQQACTDGACVCPAGTDYCDGQCFDLQRDPENCGDCGVSCNGDLCVEGDCVALTFAGALDRTGGVWRFFNESGFDAAVGACGQAFEGSTVCTASMLDALSETGQMTMAVSLGGEPVESFWAPGPFSCDAWNHGSGTNGDEAAPVRSLNRDTGRLGGPETGTCGGTHNIGCCVVE